MTPEDEPQFSGRLVWKSSTKIWRSFSRQILDKASDKASQAKQKNEAIK